MRMSIGRSKAYQSAGGWCSIPQGLVRGVGGGSKVGGKNKKRVTKRSMLGIQHDHVMSEFQRTSNKSSRLG